MIQATLFDFQPVLHLHSWHRDPVLQESGDSFLHRLMLDDKMNRWQRLYDNREKSLVIAEEAEACQGCAHRLPDRTETEEDIHPLFRNKRQVTYIRAQCAKSAEVGAWRQGIYDRAYRGGWDAYDRHKSWRAGMKARDAVWEKITAECEGVLCKFFEAGA